MELMPDSWTVLFSVKVPVLELVGRGTLIYIAVLVFMRLMPRLGGELAVMDLVFLLLIAEAAAHGMGEYTSITEAVIVIGTLMICNYILNYLSFHFRLVERLISGAPLQVIRNGRLMHRNMRREYLTQDELMTQLRAHGIEHISDVKAAYIEGDGQLTVIAR